MERHHVIVLEVDLDEGFPVARIFVDLHAVEHVARKIQIALDAQCRKVARHVALAVEQQAVPVLQRRASEVETGVVREMRRAEQFAVEPVGPAMDRAHDAGARVAVAFEHDCLAMAADVAEQCHASRVAYQRFGVVEALQHVVITRVRHQQFVADIARTALEQDFLLERMHLRIEVPVNRKLRRRATERALACQVRHAG